MHIMFQGFMRLYIKSIVEETNQFSFLYYKYKLKNKLFFMLQ